MSESAHIGVVSAHNFDVRAALRQLAEPWLGGERVKQVIDRAAKRAGLKHSRAFEIWYGRARRVEPHEREAIFAALEQKQIEAARHEFHELRIRMARLESLLAQADQDRDRAPPDAARAMVGALRLPGRTGDR